MRYAIILLFLASFATAGEKPKPEDFDLVAHVTGFHVNTEHFSNVHHSKWGDIDVGGSHTTRFVEAVIDGKHYTLMSRTGKLPEPGDYKARRVHRNSWTKDWDFEFLREDGTGKVNKYKIVGMSEEKIE
jgi:hypothetical protein